jgi:hypothetical protein
MIVPAFRYAETVTQIALHFRLQPCRRLLLPLPTSLCPSRRKSSKQMCVPPNLSDRAIQVH